MFQCFGDGSTIIFAKQEVQLPQR